MLSVLLGDSCPSLVSVSEAGGIATFMVFAVGDTNNQDNKIQNQDTFFQVFCV